MTKKEIKAKVAELLLAGMPKNDVFSRLSGQGIKDAQLALLIASHADPRRCDTHDRKVDILLIVMFFQGVLAFVVGFGLGSQMSPNAKWVVGALMAMIPALFAWGFIKNMASVYNAYILLSIIQLPRALEGFTANPASTIAALVINVGVLAYVWYVRQQLFPDFSFISPKKVKGQYVFTN